MLNLVNLAPVFGMGGLVIAFIIYLYVKKQPAGTAKMVEIADAIHEGAMVFLKREYKIMATFVAIVFILLAIFLSIPTAIAFLSGAACSALAGFIGMHAATIANVRTTQAANSTGQAKALSISFSGGAVMGLSVASLGLIGVGICFILFGGDPETAHIISGFGMGASSIALFARVGGGIYTKSADVGADLVGKVEAGIPEDDPRNPGVIADNVGDNVGDVAGMGADIFESYVGSIIATIAIGATATVAIGDTLTLMALPLILVVVGLIASLIGIGSMNILERF
ncbi:MAG: sodium/proton-translocating pyrophosphatase, partial [Thermodesulfobacteriota bacterium]